jgi:hypothetical protein
MVVLLFDANSLSLSDAQLVRDQALRWSDSEPLWLTSIVTTGPKLTVISDFVESVELGRVLRSAAFLNAIVAPGAMPQAIRFGGNRAAQDPGAATPPVDPQLIDQRFRGITMVCETVAPIPQLKAIIYFSNSLTAAGAAAALTPGNQAMRAATNACNRANVTINPIDIRGLLAAVASPTAN